MVPRLGSSSGCSTSGRQWAHASVSGITRSLIGTRSDPSRSQRTHFGSPDPGRLHGSTVSKLPGHDRHERFTYGPEVFQCLMSQLGGVSTCLLYTSPSPRDGL